MLDMLARVRRVIVDQIDPLNLVPGGTDTCIHDLVKFNENNDIAVVGVTHSRAISLGRWREIPFATKTVWFLPVSRLDRTAKRRIPHSLSMAIGLIRYRRQIPRSVIQAHRVETGATLTLLRPARLIQFIHNDSTGLTGGNSDSMWKRLRWAYRLLERAVFKRASVVVLFNKTDSARVKALYPGALIAQTWFDPEVFAQRSQLAREAGRPLTVCLIGRLEAQKDPVLAVDVISAQRDQNVTAQLVVVGTGKLAAEMTRRAKAFGISDRVEMIGSRSRQGVADIMATSDVMLMTSHYEGSPRVLAEAGAMGLPVVATTGADTDEALQGGLNGYRVHSRKPEDLASALMKAVRLDRSDCSAAVSHRSAPAAVAALLGR